MSQRTGHKFEKIMLTNTPRGVVATPINLITLLEVYVDNFIDITNNISFEHLQRILCAMLHGIHTIFLLQKSHGSQWIQSNYRNKT